MDEEWRSVPGYDGLYEVSNLGRLRSLPRTKANRWGSSYPIAGSVLEPHINERGYRISRLARDGKTKSAKVHRLVLLAFVGAPPDGDTDTRHLNGEHGDNRLANLSWGTHKKNMHDMHLHGTSPHGERPGRAILSSEAVLEMRRRRFAGERVKDLAVEFGVASSTASYAINNKSWSPL